MLKTFTLFIMWLFTFSGFIMPFVSYGQKSIAVKTNDKSRVTNQTPIVPMPVNFHQQLNLQNFTTLQKQNFKSEINTIIKIDTVVVYSNYSNPTLFTYTYDSANNLIKLSTASKNGTNWQPNTMDTLVYDTVGNLLSSIWKNWSDNSWVNASRKLSTYASNHILITQKDQIWQDGQWQNSDSSTYTFDENNNVVSYYYQVWDTNSWVNSSFQLFTYNSAGQITEAYIEMWYDSVWLNQLKYSYAYDASGNVTTAVYEKGYLNDWIKSYKENYTYDALGNMLSYTGMSWNDTNKIWINTQRYKYTYDALGNIITRIGENWVNNAWVKIEKGNYTYNNFGGVQSQLNQGWKDSAWFDSTLYSYTYDSYGDALKGDFFIWDRGTWMQNKDNVLTIPYNYNADKEYFTGYHVDAVYNTKNINTGISGISDPNIDSFTCFPNPATTYSVIRFVTTEKTAAKLILYNINGQAEKTLFKGNLNRGKHSYKVNLSDIPKGIYVVVLFSGKYTQSVKLIKGN